jgi:hypothetical protein
MAYGHSTTALVSLASCGLKRILFDFRFVYVKATGVASRWRKVFTVVLCEVSVY